MAAKKKEELRVKWACPKCGADANEHGKGGSDKCMEVNGRRGEVCQGFLCECADDGTELHGETFSNPCPEANCYHCGYGGVFPVKPKGLQAWEKKALDAGWIPSDARRKELGL